MDLDIINKEKQEKALLIAVDTGDYDAEVSIAELSELAKTAGAEVVGEMIQKRPTIEGATFVGKGRLEEIAEFCESNDIDLIIADGELTPVQVRNIEDRTDTRVVDRTTLILDIFAGRARSKEGKLQVELAQLSIPCQDLQARAQVFQGSAAASVQEVPVKLSWKAINGI